MRRFLFALLPALCAPAQGPADPPALIQLVQVPGIIATPFRQYANARATVDVLGMTAITGEPESWFLEMHSTFGSIEDLDQQLTPLAPASRDQSLSPPRTIIGRLRPEWGYHPYDAARLLPRARYFHVSIYRIRAGTEGDFGGLVKLRRESQDSVNLDRPELAYEVISGASSGTFFFLAPIVSLRAFDQGVPNTPEYAQGIASQRAEARAKTAPATELSREHLLFRVQPALSYVSDDFASADPAFWRGK